MNENYKQQEEKMKKLKENADIRIYTNDPFNETTAVNEEIVKNKIRFEMENVHMIQQVILLSISFNRHTDEFHRWTARRERLWQRKKQINMVLIDEDITRV